MTNKMADTTKTTMTGTATTERNTPAHGQQESYNNLARMQTQEAFAWNHLHMPNEKQLKAKALCMRYNLLEPDKATEKQEILQQLLGTCTPLAFIENGFHCDYGFNIHCHGMAFLNYNVTILDTSPVHLGHGVLIGPGCVLSCAGHAIHPEQRAEGIGTTAPITLEDGVWLGANVTVCPGVTIGAGTVVGAGSVVTRDLPAGVIAVGSPARVLRPITQQDCIAPDQIF